MTIKDDNFYTNPMFTSPEEVKVADPPARGGLPQVAVDPTSVPASKDFSWSSYKGQLDWLPRRTIYLTRHGSHAYGTSLPTSDLDIRGVAIAPMHYYTGFLDRFEQAESKDPDLVVFELRKFFSLAADANPNALEILFTDPSDYLRVTPFGDRLLSIRKMFLSKKAKHTLSGYAISQLKRINTHYRWLKNPPKAPPTRKEFGLPERTVIPQDQLAAAQAAVDKQLAVWNFTGLDTVDPATRIALQGSMAELLAEIKVSADRLPEVAARAIGYDENFIELLDRERHYTGRKREWDNYQTWKKTRNPARAVLEELHGYDCYTDDTEFLTDGGWKYFDSVTANDKLATVFVNWSDDAMTHRREFGVEYQAFTERFDGTFTGNLYHFEGNHLDVLVTPNHRMLMRKRERASRKTSEWELSEAAHVPDTFEFLHTVAAKEKTYGTSSVFDGLPIGETPYLRLMGWYLSDGSMAFRPSGIPDDIRISQKKGGRLYGSMLKFARKYAGKGVPCTLYEYEREPTAFRPYKITEAVLSVRHLPMAERMLRDCGCTDGKRIPRWVFTLSERLMEILFDAMAAGDGTIRDTSLKSTIYYTNLPGLADDVQELAFLCGWETSIYGPYEPHGMYHVHVHKHAARTRTLIRCQNLSKVAVENRRIVCFSVPNSTLVVRRKGHVSVQGNCKHGMHLVRLMWTCRDLLTTGEYIVRRPDAEVLLTIRNGAWSYDKLIEFAEAEDKTLTELAKTCTILPKEPPRKQLNELCAGLIEEFNVEIMQGR